MWGATMVLVMCVESAVAGLELDKELEGKRRIGAWYRRHRTDASLWPDGLRDWATKNKPSGGELRQKELLTWMALETGYKRLIDPDIVNLYGKVERWHGAKDFRGYLHPVIYAGTLRSKFLTFPIGKERVFADPLVIVKVLEAEADPFEGQPRAWY